MPTLRESIRPILTITVASIIIMLLLSLLDTTEWAAGIRAGFSAEGSEGFKGDSPGGAILFIAPLLKTTFFIGIPALITVGVHNLINRFGTR